MTQAGPLVPNPCLHVLRTPHALPMVLAAIIGRLPLSMVGLGSVLLVQSDTGSSGLGGVVAAAVGGPLFAGQRHTEPPPAPHEHRDGAATMRVPGLRVFFVVGPRQRDK